MKFKRFINIDKNVAITISIGEYENIKPILKEFYTDKHIKHIDEFCKYKPLSEKFLLCNPHQTEEIGIPMMLQSAVTFVDRIPFKEVEF